MLERVRGGEPQDRGVNIHGMRPGDHLRELSASLLRCAGLEQVLCSDTGGEDTRDQDDTSRDLGETVQGVAAEGAAGAKAFCAASAGHEIRSDPYGASFNMAEMTKREAFLLT